MIERVVVFCCFVCGVFLMVLEVRDLAHRYAEEEAYKTMKAANDQNEQTIKRLSDQLRLCRGSFEKDSLPRATRPLRGEMCPASIIGTVAHDVDGYDVVCMPSVVVTESNPGRKNQ